MGSDGGERAWKLRGSDGVEVHFAPRGWAPPPFALGLAGDAAARRVGEWFRDAGAPSRADAVLRSIVGQWSVSEPAELRRWLCEALREGRLRAWRLPPRTPRSADAAGESADGPGDGFDAVRPEAKTWIGLKLEYEGDPPRPIPFARYILKLPDGTERNGRLNNSGAARVEGIDPGMCEVTFPDHDARKGPPSPHAPAVKGNTPRARRVSATNAASAVALAPETPCEAVAVELLDRKGSPMKRRPSPAGVLQVVANPGSSRKYGGELSGGLEAVRLNLTREAEEIDPTTGEKRTQSSAIGFGHGGLSGSHKETHETQSADGKKRTRSAGVSLVPGGAAKLDVELTTEYERLIGQWERSPSLGDFACQALGTSKPAEKAEPEKAEPEKSTLEWKISASGQRMSGGYFPLRASLLREPDCGVTHALRVYDVSLEGPEACARLPRAEGGAQGSEAKPTVYAVRGAGCRGAGRSLRVEVFPSEQLLLAASLELSASFGPMLAAVSEWVRGILGAGVKLTWSCKGSVEVFEGWREERKTWEVYYSSELALKAKCRVAGELEGSLLTLVAKVPPSFTQYVGDITGAVKLGGGPDLALVAASTQHPARTPRGGTRDEVTFAGAIEVEVSAKVRIGAKGILAVEFGGSLSSGVSITAKGRCDPERVALESVEGKIAPGVLKLKVLTVGMRWASGDEWTWELWTEKSHEFESLRFALPTGTR